jgi:3-polyprenyl-4-hydroxybenzoate decarboxylase
MEWALATRFQPDRDFVCASAFRTIPLDPSLASHASLGSKAGYDCTMPIGTQKKLEAEIPEPPHYRGARFASVEDALREGPKFFEQLMTAVGSEDGREIVLELEDLSRAGRLTRDAAEGRYSLVK